MSRFCLLTVGAFVGLFSLEAAAQEPAGAPDDDAAAAETPAEAAPEAGEQKAPPRPPAEEPDEDGPEPPLVTPAPDTLGGHIQLSPSFGYVDPFAKLEAGVSQSDAMGSGWGLGLDAAYGVSRSVMVGVWGQYQSLGGPDSCSACSASSTAFGAFVRYHLVQGMRFDPWMAAGLGYRITKLSGIADDPTYSGIEWLRLQVGGDWYAFDAIGFGPFLELDMGRYSSRSPGSVSDAANHWTFSTGARITLDIPGK